MSHTRIKVCGITRVEDARAAAEAGADAVGLVFYPPSPRGLDEAGAAEIVAALPPFVSAVGLFLDPARDAVERVLDSVAPDLLQFHGSEPGTFCRSFGRPYIKAVGMAESVDWETIAAEYPDARGLLVDSHGTGGAGGTGRTFDWNLLPRDVPRPVILAGGLQPENVCAAVRAVRPAAVDVSSGVESAPGIKDGARLREFILEVRRGDRNEEPA